MALFHCGAWDEEATVLSVTGEFPNIDHAQKGVNDWLDDFAGNYWECQVTQLVPPKEGQGFYENGETRKWDYERKEGEE